MIEWILVQALQDYHGVQVGANVHVSDLAFSDDIVILHTSNREIRKLLEAVIHHIFTDGKCINASMSALIPGDHH